MKTLINQDEKNIVDEIYELIKVMPNDVLRDFRTMIFTAKMLMCDKTEEDAKGA